MTSGTDSALKYLVSPLAQLGFRKRAGTIFTADLADGVLGWLGLNKGSRHRPAGEVEVNPVVGVRHQAVEHTLADLLGEKFHRYVPSTVSSPIGYLMPQGRYKAWVFSDHRDDIDREAAGLAAAVASHGLPFMRSLLTLQAARKALEDGLGHSIEYKLPVVLMLLGEYTDARAAVDNTEAGMKGRDDPAAHRFRRFAAELRNQLR